MDASVSPCMTTCGKPNAEPATVQTSAARLSAAPSWRPAPCRRPAASAIFLRTARSALGFQKLLQKAAIDRQKIGDESEQARLEAERHEHAREDQRLNV